MYGALSDCAAHAAQCPQRPEEGISSPRTGVQMVGILVSN